jgi:pimeloyl-ACP methyl ester carboxylesterase
MNSESTVTYVEATLPRAETHSIEVKGATFAYRDLGPRSGTPLILLNHWGATLDDFPPAIVAGLAQFHRVIAMDYRGIGASGGVAPVSIDKMADDTLLFVRSLGFDEVHLLGFSLGGFVAQDVALKMPALVRKLVLSDTAPAGGHGNDRVGAISWPLILKGLMALREPMPRLLSHANDREAASIFLRRLKERKAWRANAPRPRAVFRQLKAIKAWGEQAPQDLSRLQMPVLIARVDKDILVPTALSFEIARRIPHAQLINCPNAGHESDVEHHHSFVRKTLAFLGQ